MGQPFLSSHQTDETEDKLSLRVLLFSNLEEIDQSFKKILGNRWETDGQIVKSCKLHFVKDFAKTEFIIVDFKEGSKYKKSYFVLE